MNFPETIPFLDLIGAELQRFAADKAEITCISNDQLCNSFGNTHGGVLMTLLDVAMLFAARSPAMPGDPPRARVVTLDMQTAFLRSAEGELRACGSVLHRSGTLAFCDALIWNDQDQVVARATGVFKTIVASSKAVT